MANGPKIRVLIADDHAILRAGLRMLIDSQPDMKVIAEAPNGEEAVRLAGAEHPDVVILDITMPGGGGLRAVPEILKVCASTRGPAAHHARGAGVPPYCSGLGRRRLCAEEER